jgi:four helix bundle protein
VTGVRSQEPGARSQAATSGAGYRRVIAFQRADALARKIYPLSRKVAEKDRWLASQLSRAAVSAPLNIVGGHGRGTLRDYLRFLETASSSLSEVEYLLEFIGNTGLLDRQDILSVEPLRREASAVLTGLIKALRKKAAAETGWNRNMLSDEHEEYIVNDGA